MPAAERARQLARQLATAVPSAFSSRSPASATTATSMGALSWLVPSGSVSLHHATKTVDLPKKRRKSAAANGDSRNGGGDGPGSGSDTDTDTDTISLAGLCENTMPKTCRLNPLLFNGHLQTCCTVIYKEDVPVYYKRWIFDAKPPENYAGTFAVDFVVPPQAKEEEKSKQMQEGDAPTEAGETAAPHAAGPSESSPLLPAGPGDAASKSPPRPLPERTSFYAPSEFASLGSQTDTTPMLVVLHGLSGGSHEIYVRHILRPLCYEHGWAACVVNSRGCAQSSITTPMFYNARATWDVRQTVRWLREKYPRRPLFGIGFSLGANILANYVGEEGDACLLKSAIYVSNPWNLDAGSLALQRTFIGREVYSRAMGNNMKRLFNDHLEMISKHRRVNVERIRRITYLHEFDRELQGPVWGYPTETAYYRDATSTDSIFAMKIPFLVIHAEDDPISQKECLPYGEVQATPYGVMCTSSWGGHLGWFQSGATRWLTAPVVNYLTTLVSEIDLDAPVGVPAADADAADSVAAVDRPLPDVPAPGTAIVGTKASVAASGAEPHDGPVMTYEPMRRKLAMPHLAGREYS